MDRKMYIAGIRALADFLEVHPEMPWPNNLGPNFYAFVAKGRLSLLLRQASFTKHAGESFFDFAHQVAPETFYQLSISRAELCDQVLVGTRKVKKPVVPVVSETEIEVDEPVYEWRCPKSILEMGGEEDK